jgi:hypothetical protein
VVAAVSSGPPLEFHWHPPEAFSSKNARAFQAPSSDNLPVPTIQNALIAVTSLCGKNMRLCRFIVGGVIIPWWNPSSTTVQGRFAPLTAAVTASIPFRVGVARTGFDKNSHHFQSFVQSSRLGTLTSHRRYMQTISRFARSRTLPIQIARMFQGT